MKATVLYYSHRGRTAQYAREIAMYLWSKGLNVSLSAITEFDASKMAKTDILFLGCWTSGWFVFHQHPHEAWKAKAKELLSDFVPEKIALFTTYKFRTGSMFSNMRRALKLPQSKISCRLQSKTGLLSAEDKKMIDQMLG